VSTHHRGLGLRSQGEIDEARTSHLGLGHQRRCRQFGQKQGGQLAWIAARGLGQLQGQIGGEIAVAGLLGTFQHDSGIGLRGRNALQGGT
jgi:hypothetical protein